MKALLLLPFVMGSIAAARVMNPPASAVTDMDPNGDINFEKMSAEDRNELIQELQAAPVERREASDETMNPVGDDYFAHMSDEDRDQFIAELTGSDESLSRREAEPAEASVLDPTNDMDFSKMTVQEREDLIHELIGGTMARRDLAATGGLTEEEIDYFINNGNWDAESDADPAEDDEDDAHLATRELDDSDYADVQQSMPDSDTELTRRAEEDYENNPELQKYISDGHWDNEEDVSAQLDAEDGDEEEEDSNLSRREALAEKAVKKAAKKAPTNPKDLPVLQIYPKCIMAKNPTLKCRIIQARRCWCRDNKPHCLKMHPWLYDALFTNKAKKAAAAKGAGGKPPKPSKAKPSVYEPVKSPAPKPKHSKVPAGGVHKPSAKPSAKPSPSVYEAPPISITATYTPATPTAYKQSHPTYERRGLDDEDEETDVDEADDGDEDDVSVDEADVFGDESGIAALMRRDRKAGTKVPVKPKCLGKSPSSHPVHSPQITPSHRSTLFPDDWQRRSTTNTHIRKVPDQHPQVVHGNRQAP